MIKNYIKIALRNIKRQKLYSLITMSGLILGLSIFIMFALLVDFTSKYDAFHEDSDRIYAVVQVFSDGRAGEKHSAITPAPLAPALLSEIPEIEKAARFFPPGRVTVKYRDKVFFENGVRFVDADFLSIFSFKLISGERESALSRVNSVVMTEDSVLKYFGNEDPLGKTLTLNGEIDVIVTGITANIPRASSLRYDFLVSMETGRMLSGWSDEWNVNNQAAFLFLSEGFQPSDLEGRFSSFIEKYYPDIPKSPQHFYLHPLRDFFLGSEDIECVWGSGRVSYVTLWIVAVLLLIIACINFMNISTARFITRAHEVGMRKVVGANRSQLIKQFLGEATIMAMISMPAAILLYEVLRPVFVANFGEIFGISIMDSPRILILIVGVTILTGIFSGSYPAFYLSAYKPASIFQRRLVTGKKGSRLRKILVVVQFTFSIILVLMTVISMKQSRHNLNVDLGYDRRNIIALTLSDGVRDRLKVFKSELLRSKDINSVSASAALPIEWNMERKVLPEGIVEDDALDMNAYAVDTGFIEMLGIDMIQGRSFSRDFADSENFIINETAVRFLPWKQPLGKRLTMGEQEGTIIGVAADFHFKSILLERLSPAVLYLGGEDLNYMLVKYPAAESLSGVLEFIRAEWNAIAPDLPFEYITLENAFYDVFQGDKTEEMTGTLGALAVFLSCLGLFGLSTYSVERRIKEIGIRKVLGASVSRIVGMLTRDFIKLVVIANIIAIPVAYFMMKAMIDFIYAYPTRIGIELFVITAGMTLLIAFLTVSSQTFKSALANPVESLKYE